jgi:predicted nucleic acid-binding Zn ribbon protein
VIQANKVMPAVVAEILRKAPLSDEKVTLAWRLAVGPQIAKVTSVRLVADGTLHIKTDSQAWIDAVRKSNSLIQIRMGDLLGENLVKRLEFR